MTPQRKQHASKDMAALLLNLPGHGHEARPAIRYNQRDTTVTSAHAVHSLDAHPVVQNGTTVTSAHAEVN
jgi:hypothetical protein